LDRGTQDVAHGTGAWGCARWSGPNLIERGVWGVSLIGVVGSAVFSVESNEGLQPRQVRGAVLERVLASPGGKGSFRACHADPDLLFGAHAPGHASSAQTPTDATNAAVT
jgi:hypothetical protein